MTYFTRVCALFVLLSVGAGLAAQELAAIYQASDADVRRVDTDGWEAFLSDHTRQRAAGYRLTDLETYRPEGGKRRFAGLYTQSALRDSVGRAAGWAEFVRLKRLMAAAEFTLIDVAAVANNESDFDFYGVWVKEDHPTIHKVWFLNSEETTVERTTAMAADRFKIKKVHVVPVPNGEPAFVVLYHFSPINRFNFLHFSETAAAFAKEVAERRRSGVQLIDYAQFRMGNEVRYLGIFQDSSYDNHFISRLPVEELPAKTDSLGQVGMRLLNLSVNDAVSDW